jgi:hypothetical protein
MYFDCHAHRLVKDKNRQNWWIDHLAAGLKNPKRSRVQRWLLLELCIMTDPYRIQQLQQSPETPMAIEEDRKPPMREPSPEDPFLVVKEDATPPAFDEALHKIADPLGISFEVWGIDSDKMPPARILPAKLELVQWPGDKSFIIGQESWSDPKESTYEWGVRFFRIVGRRVPYGNVSIPGNRKDGLFFFSFNRKLYVWPKAEMDAGVLRMLHVAGLIDNAKWTQLVKECGFRKLETTLTGE